MKLREQKCPLFFNTKISSHAGNDNHSRSDLRQQKRVEMEVIMTRDDVKKLFPDATDEQITQIINQNNAEVAKEKAKAEKLKSDAEKAAELQAKLDELEAGNLSEVQKAQKDLEAATQKQQELEQQLKEMKFKNGLAEKGITGEQADGIVKAFMSGDFETATTSISQIISDRETSAAAAKEKELLDKTEEPGGSGAGGNKKETTAEKLVKDIYGGKKQENDILSHYVAGGNNNV